MTAIPVATHVDRWIAHWQPNPDARLRLFCFAYAGGSATIFRAWGDELPRSVEVCPVQLPGRGTRFTEPPFTRLTRLVQDLASALLPYLTMPYALFGHSMGALVSFELARELRRQGLPGPRHLYVSGRHAPSVPDPVKLSPLSDGAFVSQLRRYQGTPDHVLDSPELMAVFLPTLRADFTLCETYQYRPQPPLACPITAFGGVQDETVSEAALVAWRAQTRQTFAYYLFPGAHFFLHTNRRAFLRTLSDALDEATGQL